MSTDPGSHQEPFNDHPGATSSPDDVVRSIEFFAELLNAIQETRDLLRQLDARVSSLESRPNSVFPDPSHPDPSDDSTTWLKVDGPLVEVTVPKTTTENIDPETIDDEVANATTKWVRDHAALVDEIVMSTLRRLIRVRE